MQLLLPTPAFTSLFREARVQSGRTQTGGPEDSHHWGLDQSSLDGFSVPLLESSYIHRKTCLAEQDFFLVGRRGPVGGLLCEKLRTADLPSCLKRWVNILLIKIILKNIPEALSNFRVCTSENNSKLFSFLKVLEWKRYPLEDFYHYLNLYLERGIE